MHNLLKDFVGFLAYKLVNFMTTNYPNYIESHPRFTVSNVYGELYGLFNLLYWFFVALFIFILIKLIRNFIYYKDKASQARMSIIEYWTKRKRYCASPGKIFTKRSTITFIVAFLAITYIPVLTFIAGYKSPDFSDGFRLEELAYSPGNQPITDEIVNAMNENVIPEVVKTGEMIMEVITDPALGAEIVEEVTGVDIEEIQQELD